MRVRIEVTQNDIRKGKRGSCFNCPIARAVKRATGCKDVDVDSDGTISLENGEVVIPSSIKRERFIEKFDDKEKVSPIVFLVNIPKSVLV